MTSSWPGHALPFLLLGAFRAIIDELHIRLAAVGHPGLRPAHGIAMQMIGSAGVTISDLGLSLGVSKQAASKTVERLEKLGYAVRVPSKTDLRQRLVFLTPRGVEALSASGRILNDLRAEWVETIGTREMDDLEDALAQITGPDGIDRFFGWLGA